MRVLHIAQPLTTPAPWFAFSRSEGHCAGEGGLLAAAGLVRESAASNPDEEHVVAVLGPQRAGALCRHLRLRGVSHVVPPLGQAHRSAPGLRRLIARTGPLDAVVCWGTNLRRLARRIAHVAPRWLEVDMQSGDASFLRPGRGEVSAPVASAVAGAWGARAPADARATARAKLGLAQHENSIALLTDAACPASATNLLGSAAMLQTAGMGATYIIPAACDEFARAERRVREGTYARRVILTDLPASLAAQGADIAVCCPADASALARHASLSHIARAAVSAGTMVVAPDAWADAWLLENSESASGSSSSNLPAFLVRAKGGTPTDVARALVPLMVEAVPPVRPPVDGPRFASPLLAVLRAEVGATAHR